MKEDRITMLISAWSSLILANVVENEIVYWIMIVQAIVMVGRYAWLCGRK